MRSFMWNQYAASKSIDFQSLGEYKELFLGLLSLPDDGGSITSGNVTYIRNTVYNQYTEAQRSMQFVENGLALLESLDMIRRYTVGGHPYIWLVNWNKWQRLNNYTSTYPSPPLDVLKSIPNGIELFTLPFSELHKKLKAEAKKRLETLKEKPKKNQSKNQSKNSPKNGEKKAGKTTETKKSLEEEEEEEVEVEGNITVNSNISFEEEEVKKEGRSNATATAINVVDTAADIGAVGPTADIGAVAPTADIGAVAPTADIGAVAPAASAAAQNRIDYSAISNLIRSKVPEKVSKGGIERLITLLSNFGEEYYQVCELAIERANEQGKDSFGYILSIVKSWVEKGFKSLKEILDRDNEGRRVSKKTAKQNTLSSNDDLSWAVPYMQRRYRQNQDAQANETAEETSHNIAVENQENDEFSNIYSLILMELSEEVPNYLRADFETALKVFGEEACSIVSLAIMEGKFKNLKKFTDIYAMIQSWIEKGFTSYEAVFEATSSFEPAGEETTGERENAQVEAAS